jgi:UDP-N-acetylglucosamine--N-acetylmuramyl-(pentapeptide) pyrophosphoryl-undecaprenol N-acetylglucosamine transferase
LQFTFCSLHFALMVSMRCVIAGGGTGGHLFPGVAIAEAFIEKEMGNEVLFIGTERGIESRVLTGGKFALRTIQVRPLTGKSLRSKGKALWTLPGAILEAISILKEFRPQIVLGVGGYASGPALLAAFLLRIKRAIHEQNLVPGMTNRILKWFSQRIFVSFEESKEYFPRGRVWVTGTPVRKEFLASHPAGQEGLKRVDKDLFSLLVFGGSAGAQRINRAMTEALGSLEGIKPFLKIVHQTGREDLESVSKIYRERGFHGLASPFFEEMAAQYKGSDLVICRSGASTIAELAICGRAAILVPYPHAARQHQLINAQKLVDLGAAKMIRDEELNGASLSKAILHLYAHPEERTGMEEEIRKLGHPGAAREIVDRIYALAG